MNRRVHIGHSTLRAEKCSSQAAERKSPRLPRKEESRRNRDFLSVFAILILILLNTGFANAKSSNMQFVWLGVNGIDTANSDEPRSDTDFYLNHQFSQNQIIQIAENFDIVVIEKFHAYANLAFQIKDAQKLKELNPALKVLVCVDARHVFDGSDFIQEMDLHEEWYLHNVDGNRVRFKDFGWWMDLSNPDLRSALLQRLAGYVMAQDTEGNPILDGIAFDNCYAFNLKECRQTRRTGCNFAISVGNAIGDEKLKNLDDGVAELLTDAKNVFKDKLVIYNGVAGLPWIYRHSLDYLDNSDGALNEQFGYFGDEISPAGMISYVNMMYSFPARIFLKKVNLPPGLSGSSLQQALRRTLGYFMLGYQPGNTFYKAGSGYSATGELAAELNPSELQFDFGNPVMDYAFTSEDLFRRDFENGMVLLNYRYEAIPFVADRTIQLINGNLGGPVFRPGQQVTIAANDAWFFKFVHTACVQTEKKAVKHD